MSLRKTTAALLMAGLCGVTAQAQEFYIPGGGAGSGAAVQQHPGGNLIYTPTITVGDPAGVPSVVIGDRIDPNVTSSAFAGVVSWNPIISGSGNSYICTGALISPTHILTAVHCGDEDNDGDMDELDLGASAVIFNISGGPVVASIASVDVHPDYTGFNNPVLNDDIAIITLAAPAPAGVPIYPMSTDPFNTTQSLILAGYGTTGDAINGYTGAPSFTVKHTTQNLAGAALSDAADEGDASRTEIWFADIDGPTAATDTLSDGGTFGNEFEGGIGGGDSGGPAFLWDDDGDTIPEADELTIFGTNTFSAGGGSIPTAPLFGSQLGGMVVSTYQPWIQSVIPEPNSAVLLLLGVGALARRRRQA